MFAGLNTIDWASKEHARGSAADVPDILRGLLSEDTVTRERALDDYLDALHRDGEVLMCTVATVPFLLEAAVSSSVPDRGELLALLASVAADTPEDKPHREAARAVLTGGLADLLPLLDDDDPAVRRHVPETLLACRDRWDAVLPALRDRVAREPDPEARAAMTQAVGRAARSLTDGAEAARTIAWLTAQAGNDQDPAVQLRAVGALAAIDSDEAVKIAVRTVRHLFTTTMTPPLAAVESGRQPTTLTGVLRHLAERAEAGTRLPWLGPITHDVHTALGPRIAERQALLADLLRTPNWEVRQAACYAAGELVRGWRSPDYAELACEVAALLTDDEPRLSRAAAKILADFGEEAAPAADMIADALYSARPGTDGTDLSGWFTVYGNGDFSPSPLLSALAAAGDQRAVPGVRRALELDRLPVNVAGLLDGIGTNALELLPLLQRRMFDLHNGADDREVWKAGLLATAIGRLGAQASAAVPDITQLLATEVTVRPALNALGEIGRQAAAAAPAVERLLTKRDPALRLDAAATLWHITGDPAPAVDVLPAALQDDNSRICVLAAQLATTVGPAAAEILPYIKQALLAAEPLSWASVQAAVALWRVSGEPEPTVTMLIEMASRNIQYLRPAAACFAEIGPGARSAQAILTGELRQARRFNNSGGGVYLSNAVSEDLDFLRTCTRALNRVTA
ncbi:HEAT repeat domain-containing protein [Rhizohabitans arisaemae]|uniref:HEAT repeat domain-containing protein n=1 Tax=Rhizohabitans arisaemae TaxID=2720610 RepID=UPI0024B27EE3|nr:HEAT repeat domain-containing protein [Rhizohabitans arisaemae]